MSNLKGSGVGAMADKKPHGHGRSASLGEAVTSPPRRDTAASKAAAPTGPAKKDGEAGGGGGAPANTKEVHLLALKVMRLTRPRLMRTAPVPHDPADFGAGELAAALENDAETLADLPAFGLGEVCTLPQSFGSIFLGEIFSCYLSLNNESTETCTDVMVTAELQTGNDRTQITPAGADADKVSLAPGHSYDTVQCSEVKEPGTHLLVCNVNYRNPEGEKKYFRKFFKFVVYKPLDIKTVTYNSGGEIFLEAQVKNITQAPMFFEKVKLHPSPTFCAADLNVVDGDAEGDAGPALTTFTSNRYLKPHDVQQHLYRLTPREPSLAAKASLAVEVGKLEIVWRTNLGELGRLQTNMLPRTPLPVAPLEVEAVQMPAEARTAEVFTIAVKITNKGTQALELYLREVPEKAGRIHFAGTANQALGVLAPGQQIGLPLPFVSSGTGLLAIRGLALYDKSSNRQFEIMSLPLVFVSSQ
mmetsp:Transcript_7599/g.19602  ORF Transcript_7599/g.19602 Transcript_7599/m.19602 type:complete len:472 (+) Transcript_7599:14-1429(+)|eukprot:CAMPEP_0182918268 /NCGR_PEP_ID=MMETSP0105_2-20130417/1991_1 /TAXON_ID=81532 ORGANISM="Acanthoeca-like sp., Strain 10tr" /NCGR_SAMPLE_ID=MMETSP0105_2 /ASSEMBLY_ACC=CAM_ASM_000205 /LENGTH=471 /DNA_ID=CAMNT_0025055337 /DNA_START=6 /DNA_END=1421 /DNA_ORIENTATION=-